jgi:hypothetical protein
MSDQLIKRLILSFLFLSVMLPQTFAHGHHEMGIGQRQWHLTHGSITGTFLYHRGDSVFIENKDHEIVGFPMQSFCTEEQLILQNKLKAIDQLNHEIDIHHQKKHPQFSTPIISKVWLLIIIINCCFFYLWFKHRKRIRLLIATATLGFGCILLGFTDPNIIRNAFLPFAPNVNTFWDDTYFYVESKGIPATHEMMVGISNHGWQQQVPIPQCYIGANAWSIPLNPVMSSNPIPVDDVHFTRGAIAIAVNGVPIFNPHTNTGVDALTDGQLDLYGGHCGRGDDYHYHTAPLHLYNSNFSHLPIAYAFDGFAVYGNLEPDGSVMATLDNNHGHFYNGEYHYHGTSASPYMIAQFAGVVTEDATNQLIPQAQAHPVRTENWTPLNGALITACLPNNSGNGYQLNYTLNNTAGYAVNYAWNGTTYTFDYITPNSNNTIEYIGFEQCQIPTAIQQADYPSPSTLFPNPFIDHVQLTNPTKGQYFQLFNATGQLLFSTFDLHDQNFSQLSPGTYFLNILPDHQTYRLIKN